MPPRRRNPHEDDAPSSKRPELVRATRPAFIPPPASQAPPPPSGAAAWLRRAPTPPPRAFNQMPPMPRIFAPPRDARHPSFGGSFGADEVLSPIEMVARSNIEETPDFASRTNRKSQDGKLYSKKFVGSNLEIGNKHRNNSPVDSACLAADFVNESLTVAREQWLPELSRWLRREIEDATSSMAQQRAAWITGMIESTLDAVLYLGASELADCIEAVIPPLSAMMSTQQPKDDMLQLLKFKTKEQADAEEAAVSRLKEEEDNWDAAFAAWRDPKWRELVKETKDSVDFYLAKEAILGEVYSEAPIPGMFNVKDLLRENLATCLNSYKPKEVAVEAFKPTETIDCQDDLYEEYEVQPDTPDENEMTVCVSPEAVKPKRKEVKSPFFPRGFFARQSIAVLREALI